MEIITVKETRNDDAELSGYRVNNSLSVPLVSGNRHYKQVIQWIEDGGIVDPYMTAEELVAKELYDAKQAKLNALAVLTVTTSNGNEFDADDIARQDMLSAIIASDTLGLTEKEWKLADNTWKIIQLSELKEASALAIQAKGAILAGA